MTLKAAPPAVLTVLSADLSANMKSGDVLELQSGEQYEAKPPDAFLTPAERAACEALDKGAFW